MAFQSLVTDLLLRWDEEPSLPPEELSRPYAGQAEQAALVEAVRRGIRDLRAAAGFLLSTPADAGRPPDRGAPLAEHPDRADDLAADFAAEDRLNRWAAPLREASLAA